MEQGIPQPVALTGSDQQVATGGAWYCGYTVRETAGAAAIVRVYDGTSASGRFLGQVTLAANGECEIVHPRGVRAAGGVFVDIVSGAVAGSVLVG